MDFGGINPIILIATLMASAVPILLAALGETVVERSGVLNLGVEGMMIIGALLGFAVAVAKLWKGLRRQFRHGPAAIAKQCGYHQKQQADGQDRPDDGNIVADKRAREGQGIGRHIGLVVLGPHAVDPTDNRNR